MGQKTEASSQKGKTQVIKIWGERLSCQWELDQPKHSISGLGEEACTAVVIE